MENHSIELFMPLGYAGELPAFVQSLAAEQRIKHIWLWGLSPVEIQLPEKAEIIVAGSTLSTAFFREMARLATADYLLYVSKPGVTLFAEELFELCDTMPSEASMAYGHYRKIVNEKVQDAPTIDCLDGSLRNDFDFGPVRLFKVPALKKYLELELAEYKYAGLYQLRLALSRIGTIYHYDGCLSAENESDNRKSGERQFDYVNPAQRDVQVEMERACARHLKDTGALLPPCKYSGIDLSIGDFPVEASVIIPVLNREKTVADAISSVLAQKCSFDFNVLVVDNHSTDRTGEIIDSFNDGRVVHIVPEANDLGIGGCWNLAVNDSRCGRFAVQLDSDDLYSDEFVLQKVVDEFYKQGCAMLVGTYRICDFDLNTLPPGVIDHREWTEDNGRNNALRINGLGAPRAFYTPVIRKVGFPNVSYGEDYAVGLQISRGYRIGRIYDVLYLCRRWGGNSDAALSHEKVNANNLYKDSLRTVELNARKELMKSMKIPAMAELVQFFERQLECWGDATERYRALEKVCQKRLCNGITLQFNPSRAVSASAKVDKESIERRKCFLCTANRPACQLTEDVLGSMELFVNPYPILPFHFTLPLKEHVPQELSRMYADMLLLAREWQGMALFYNGARCGASAPDHAHLQAVRAADVPMLGGEWHEAISSSLEPLRFNDGGVIYRACGYLVPLFVLQSSGVAESMRLMRLMMSAMPLIDGEVEPRMNVFCYYASSDGYVTIVIPRSKHRPECYGIEGEKARMVSPGALDMAALMITPRENDYMHLCADEALAILKEVGIGEEDAAEISENIISAHENN